MGRRVLLVLALVLFLTGCQKGSYRDGYADGYELGLAQGQLTPATQAETTAPQPTQPEPVNGYAFREIPFREALASLSLSANGREGCYFVIDPIRFPEEGEGEFYTIRAQLHANSFDSRVYVRGGSTVELRLPLGDYDVYFARGEVWQGEETLFGEDTAYFRFDDTVRLKQTSSGYTQWTLSTRDAESIDASEFPET